MLCFLPLLLFFSFGGFGGAGDWHFSVDFGGVDFWLNVGWFVSHHFWGGLGFGIENIVSSGFCSLFSGETVEFILCGYEGGILGIGRMGGDKVILMENGVGDSCSMRTLCAFRV